MQDAGALLAEAQQLIEPVARRFYAKFRNRIAIEDLRSLGWLGAHEAACKWNGQGRFAGYASEQIRFAILKGLLREQVLQRKSSSELRSALEAAVPIERTCDALPPDHVEQLEEQLAKPALRALIERAAMTFSLQIPPHPSVDAADEEGGAVADPHIDVEREVDRVRLRRAVESLPRDEREVVERYGYYGESFDEIADAPGMKRSSVYYAYARAVGKLRTTFDGGDSSK